MKYVVLHTPCCLEHTDPDDVRYCDTLEEAKIYKYGEKWRIYKLVEETE